MTTLSTRVSALLAAFAATLAVLFGATPAATAAPAHVGAPQTVAAPQTVTETDPVTGLPWIEVSALPAEARTTLTLIDQGGPFPYPNNDGVVFSNREGLLPAKASGYYHEYTVPTPGVSTRGARRIVTGSGGEYFWTSDHYASFSRIRR